MTLFPTVTTREHKGGRSQDALLNSGRSTTNTLCDTINGINGGVCAQLNPDWVDWLMGFTVGWTNIDLDMPLPDYDPQYFDTEPNVPRTATGIKNRVDRIICDGNAVVPYQAYPIFKAIAEIEQA